ncbi:hypothetical protein Misp06_03129 [Microbulbifer sp. NBRC 101763]
MVTRMMTDNFFRSMATVCCDHFSPFIGRLVLVGVSKSLHIITSCDLVRSPRYQCHNKEEVIVKNLEEGERE